VEKRLVYGCISMPSNVFATTGTNVSVLFLRRPKDGESVDEAQKVCLMDASKLGEEYKEGNNQKKRLRADEIDLIVSTFAQQEPVDDFAVVVSYKELEDKSCSLSAGQYFDIKIEHIDITPEQFAAEMQQAQSDLQTMFAESERLGKEILFNIESLKIL